MDANAVAILILGVAAPFVTQLVKRYIGNPEGAQAAYVFYGVSFAIALISVLVTDGFKLDPSSPEVLVPQVVNATLAVLALGTIVYNMFKAQLKKMEPEKNA